jgi:hypothetical protein
MNPATAGLADSVTVTAHDAYGNLATGYTGTVHFTSTDAKGTLPSNYTFTPADHGAHTFNATLLTAGTQHLTVTDTNSPGLTGSGPGVSVSPAATSVLVVNSFPASVTAGVAGSFLVMVTDAYGNVTPAYTGTVHFSSTDTQASLPSDYTFDAADAGQHSFTATLKTAGNQALTVADRATATIAGTQNGIAVAPAVVTHLALSTSSPAQAGSPIQLTVTALDSFNNIATGYMGTVQFGSSDNTATLPANYTFVAGDQGTHTFTVQTPTPGNSTFTAAETGTATVTGSLQVVVAPPPPATGAGVPVAGYEYGAGAAVPVATFSQGTNTTPPSAFTATIDWGDGQKTPGTVSLVGGVYQVTGAHTYTDEGTYTVQTSVSFDGTTTVFATKATVQEQLMPDGTVGTSDQRFIAQVYHDLLGRQVEQGGLDYWTAMLSRGVSRTAVVRLIENLPEYETLRIDAIFNTLLQSQPDQATQAALVMMVNGTTTYEQVIEQIVATPEFANVNGGTAAGLVTALYQDAPSIPAPKDLSRN